MYERCFSMSIDFATTPIGPLMPIAETTPGADAIDYQICERIDGAGADDFFTYPPRPQAEFLAAWAQKELVLEMPDVASSPPRGSTQLVGVPVWFWVTNSKPASATVSVPGLSATLTAEPTALHIRISGGSGAAAADNVTVDCPGSGTPYDKTENGPTDTSDCSHVFDWNDTFTIDATVDWSLSWTATNGQVGTLPTVSRTTSFTLQLEEAQAVTD
ncbi:hypothetical protein BH10ACT1_BH10ACT1_35010 [soil metagenome]